MFLLGFIQPKTPSMLYLLSVFNVLLGFIQPKRPSMLYLLSVFNVLLGFIQPKTPSMLYLLSAFNVLLCFIQPKTPSILYLLSAFNVLLGFIQPKTPSMLYVFIFQCLTRFHSALRQFRCFISFHLPMFYQFLYSQAQLHSCVAVNVLIQPKMLIMLHQFSSSSALSASYSQ